MNLTVRTAAEIAAEAAQQHIDACRVAIDAHVEAQARALDYHSASHLAGYVGSTVPEWAAEAAAFVGWRDAVWQAAFALLAQADPANPPSVEDVLAGLPAWPGGAP